jgi:enamine deaminase RidA (YjgF/YER057c/UK114 family)
LKESAVSELKRFHVGPRLSEMAIHNGTVYLAGQVPEDITGDIELQTRDVLAGVDRLLAEAGTDKRRVLMAQIFLRNMEYFEGMNRAWDAWVAPGASPPRATVEARLFNPGCLVEIVITAALP